MLTLAQVHKKKIELAAIHLSDQFLCVRCYRCSRNQWNIRGPCSSWRQRSSRIATLGWLFSSHCHAHLYASQMVNPMLQNYASVVCAEKASTEVVAFFIKNGILMHKWHPVKPTGTEWNEALQIKVPSQYHQILSRAHERQWSGHLEIKKTHQLILGHFYWPGLKGDVAQYCCSFHIYQKA